MAEVSNEKQVYAYLISKGLSDEAVAGVMGNIKQESGFDPTAKNSNSGAYGIFQWTGSRKDGLMEYAEKHKQKASSLTTQLNYFWEELQTTEKSTYEALTSDKYSSPSDFAKVFESKYERSGGSALADRQEYAENYHDALSGEYINIKATRDKNLGLNWWGEIVRVVLILLVLLVGIVLLAVSFQSMGVGVPNVSDVVKKAVKK